MENLLINENSNLEDIKSDNSNNTNIQSNNTEEIAQSEEQILENENSPEVSNATPSESLDIKPEDANTTNCLALTIQKDHKMMAIKNVFLRSIRMSWKVVVSAVTLALIKLFS